ncbi:hypothetical protein [Kibdelosporangium phytohabitans]|uniref:Uncharacterized protein n=1 Tax=Kibdelosporangium phytohabitans TaxID=860235 RepID=A0A0N9I373_9PSEU|nr:hypothetical protein [Kibdelosporangium phytohabitans]ALG08699.1 hypothetical protein AOZ06_18825 [Kibdelosporangium phytohabitans]MBE1470194.1 hypothetical protein [Kibdelosporangium phytohabitans]
MTSTRPPSSAATINAVFLFIAAAGIVLQIIVGVPGYPAVPPGPIILAVAGLLVLLLASKAKWVLFIGIIAPLFVLVGGLIEGSIFDRLGNPGDFGPFLGTALQEIGIVVALIYGIIAASQAYRKVAAH